MNISSGEPGHADWQAADPMARMLVPEWYARAWNVFPLRYDNHTLVVAATDTNDIDLEKALAFASGRSVQFEHATPEELAAAWAAGYAAEPATAPTESPSEDRHEVLDDPDDDAHGDAQHPSGAAPSQARSPRPVPQSAPPPAPELPPLQDLSMVGDDSPIAEIAGRMMDEALRLRASDMHVEATPTGGIVRIRVDGVLERLAVVPAEVYLRLVSRLKVKGDLDIADRVRPQDGRSTHRAWDGREVDMRISTIPTRDGEKLVIRFLDPGNVRTFAELGLLPAESDTLTRLLDRRDGIVALTGPTGAGKTSTLYAALGRLDTEHSNVCTVEDPIEYRLPGANQVQVNVARGVTFAGALRAFLRQDPDVILLGEIRDPETAEVAVQAALTGHLVLTTLHTNDAVSALSRLEDLKVDSVAIADALRGVVGQRLVRRLCSNCAAPYGEPDGPQELEAEALLRRRFGVTPARRVVGCDACRGSGYRGRLAIVEILTVTGAVAEAIREGQSPARIRAAAQAAGMRTMRQVAVDVVLRGETTLAEVHRVLGEQEAGPELTEPSPREPVDAPQLPASPSAAGVVRTESAPGDAAPRTPGLDFESAASAASIPGAPPTGSPRRGGWLKPTGQWDTLSAQALMTRRKGPRVLLADHDEEDLLAWEQHLAAKGWRITTAVDGEEAWTLLRKKDFDLAVLRMRLPGLSAREMLRRMRAAGRAIVPVVVVSNLSSEGLEGLLLAEGADDYVRKPLTPAEVELRALAVLRRRYPDLGV